MTDVDELLRSTLRPDSATAATRASATESGWQAIEATAAKRTRRRRTAQRAGLISAILIATAAMGGALTDESDGQPSVIRPPRFDEATAEAGSTWSSAWTIAALVLATLFAIVVFSAWRRSRRRHQSLASSTRAMARRTLDHPERFVAMVFVVIGLALPAWAYGNYIQSIGELQRRAPNLERVAALDVVSVERTWSPFVGPGDSLVTVVAAPAGSTSETEAEATVIEELAAAGLRYVPERDSYERAIDPVDRTTGSAANDWSYRDAATVNVEDETIRVGYRLTPETSRTWIPLAVFVATFIVGAATLGLLGTRLGQLVGLVVMTVAAGQFWLVVRAYASARSLLAGLDLDAILKDASAPERAEVSAATTDTYPLGLLAVVMLLAPWMLGAVAVFGTRMRRLAVVFGLGVVAAVAAFVLFGSINGAVLEILE